jgi:hypothetical protein
MDRLPNTESFYFLGWQEYPGGKIALYNLQRGNEHHPAGSTVSEDTLKEMRLI